MTRPPVRPVSLPAGRRDNLTAAQYREIYDEIRKAYSLRQFMTRIGSQVSPSWWSQYESGAKQLGQRQKNDLRRAVGLPELAPAVAEACALASEEAEVWYLGQGAEPAARVLLCAPGLSGVTVRLNGSVSVVEDAEAKPVRAGRSLTSIGGLQPATRAALAALRGPGETWDAFLRRVAVLLQDGQDGQER